MDEDGDDDERDPQPEGEVHFPEFAEQDGCEGDAVDGLEVVGQIDGEGREGAEGVELEEQLNMLRQMGCSIFQGYYIAKPITLEDFEKLAA